MLLQSAREQYAAQQKINASAVLTARRKGSAKDVAVVIAAHQAEAVALAFGSTPELLAEQGIDAPPGGIASLSSVLSHVDDVTPLAQKAKAAGTLDRLVLALVMDASRTAATVDLGRRPRLTGYVRSLNAPSCSRCAVLAGRVYRYSTGFQRHPRCDCLMTPTVTSTGRNLVIDPMRAVRDGQVRGLSKGDMQALDAGADLNQVVNVRRESAGLVVGSSVFTRGNRLTPQGIARIASDRDEALELLKQHGYVR